MSCVYCGTPKCSDEHWFPRSFGVFKGCQKLKNLVCRDCNENTKIPEHALARYGLPGLIRARRGTKGRKRKTTTASAFYQGLKHIPPLRMLVPHHEIQCEVLAEFDDGKLFYAKQLIARKDGRLFPVLIPKNVYSNEELKTFVDGKEELKGATVEYILGEATDLEFVAELKKSGAIPTRDKPTDKPAPMPSGATVHFTTTDLHARALAKIAFHYLLKFWGETYKGSEEAFAEIRAFIQGKSPPTVSWRKYVSFGEKGIASLKGVPAYSGHMIALDRAENKLEARIRFYLGAEEPSWTWRIFLGHHPSKIIVPDARLAHSLLYYEKPRGQFDGELVETPMIKGTLLLPSWLH